MENSDTIQKDLNALPGPWGLSIHWRYRLSLLLLVGVAVGLTVWFQLHIQSYVTQSLFVGVPLTILGLLKLAGSWWPDHPFQEQKEFSRRVLARRSALGYLLFAAILVVLLFQVTSSVYVEYQGGDNPGPFTVEVWRIPREVASTSEKANSNQAELVMPPLQISSYDRVKGAPFFFPFDRGWKPIDLEFRIVKPLRYKDHVERDLGPDSRVHLYIPSDLFPSKEFRIVRLIPGKGLLQLPPRFDDSETSTYSLVINFDHQEYRVNDLRLEVVYFGDRRDVIESMTKGESFERRFHPIHTYLVTINEKIADRDKRWKPEKIRERAEILASGKPKILETSPMEPGAEFVVTVLQRQGGLDKPLFKIPKTISVANGIQDVFVGVP